MAKDLMLPISQRLYLDTSLRDTLEYFHLRNHHVAAVFASDNKVQGGISRLDFLKGLIRHRMQNLSSLRLSDMIDLLEPIGQIAEDQAYAKVIQLLLTYKCPLLIVEDANGEFIGTIGESQLINRIAIREL